MGKEQGEIFEDTETSVIPPDWWDRAFANYLRGRIEDGWDSPDGTPNPDVMPSEELLSKRADI